MRISDWSSDVCSSDLGQSRRIDKNAAGHMVYQILADYQDRGQALAMLAPDAKPAALGDGWLRLMRFDLSAAVPTIAVSTYSTHFHTSSERMPRSAAHTSELQSLMRISYAHFCLTQ